MDFASHKQSFRLFLLAHPGLWLFIGKKRVRWTRFFIAQARGCLVLLLCAASGFVRQKRTQALHRTAFRLPHYTSPYRHGGQNRFATLAAYGIRHRKSNVTVRTNNTPPPAASIRVSIFKLGSRNRGFGFFIGKIQAFGLGFLTGVF